MPTLPDPRHPGLFEKVRETLPMARYSRRTEEAYVAWIRRLIRFHGGRHPRTLEAEEIKAFLTFLVVRRQVSASTQNQALAAILFLYRKVLQLDLPFLDDSAQASRPPARRSCSAATRSACGWPRCAACRGWSRG